MTTPSRLSNELLDRTTHLHTVSSVAKQNIPTTKEMDTSAPPPSSGIWKREAASAASFTKYKKGTGTGQGVRQGMGKGRSEAPEKSFPKSTEFVIPIRTPETYYSATPFSYSSTSSSSSSSSSTLGAVDTGTASHGQQVVSQLTKQQRRRQKQRDKRRENNRPSVVKELVVVEMNPDTSEVNITDIQTTVPTPPPLPVISSSQRKGKYARSLRGAPETKSYHVPSLLNKGTGGFVPEETRRASVPSRSISGGAGRGRPIPKPPSARPWLATVVPAAFARSAMIAKKRNLETLPWLLRVGKAPPISSLRKVKAPISTKGSRAPWLSTVIPAAFAQAAMIGKKRSKFHPEGLPWILRVGARPPLSTLKKAGAPFSRARSPWLSSALPAAFAQAAMIGRKKMKEQPVGKPWLLRVGRRPPLAILRRVSPPSTRGSRAPWLSTVLPAAFAQAAMINRRRMNFQPEGLPWILRVGPRPPLSSLRKVSLESYSEMPRGTGPPWLATVIPAPFAQAAQAAKRRIRDRPVGLPWILKVGPRPPLSSLRKVGQPSAPRLISRITHEPATISLAKAEVRKRMAWKHRLDRPEGKPWLLRVPRRPPLSTLRHVTPPTSSARSAWLSTAIPAPFAQAASIGKRRMKKRMESLPWPRRVGPAPPISSLRHVDAPISTKGSRSPWLSSVIPAAFGQTAMISKKRMKFQPEGLPWLLRVGHAPPISSLRRTVPPTRGFFSPWVSSVLPAPFAQAAMIGKKRMESGSKGFYLRKAAPAPPPRPTSLPWLSRVPRAPFALAAYKAKRRFAQSATGKRRISSFSHLPSPKRLEVSPGAGFHAESRRRHSLASGHIGKRSQTHSVTYLRRASITQASDRESTSTVVPSSFTFPTSSSSSSSSSSTSTAPAFVTARTIETPSSSSTTTPLSAIPASQMEGLTDKTLYDIIVIGGGLSGLTAAYKLLKEAKGTPPKVLLLEADSRLGGRILGVHVPQGAANATLDVGGQWIKPGQENILRLIEELGLQTYQQNNTGHKMLKRKDNIKSYKSGAPYETLASGLSSIQFRRTIAKLKKLAMSLVAQPMEYKDIAALDKMSVAAWAKQNNSWSARLEESLAMIVDYLFGCDVREVSMLFFLQFIAGSGRDPLKLMGNAGSKPLQGIVGGCHQLIDGLASKFVSMGGVIRIGAFVQSILQLCSEQAKESSTSEHFPAVKITTSSLESYLCKYVIMASPPASFKSIQFSPPLPTEKDLMSKSCITGSYIKCFVCYSEPFWRKNFLSGEAYVSPINSMSDTISFTQDASDPASGIYALSVSITGARAVYWAKKTIEERKAGVINSLVGFFGARASNPNFYVESDWNEDPFSRGGPFSVVPPGVLQSTTGFLRTPSHKIHWAGSESSMEWFGTMEGAVVSGQQAAFEVANRYSAFQLMEERIAGSKISGESAIPTFVGSDTGSSAKEKQAVAPPSPLNFQKNAETNVTPQLSLGATATPTR